MAFTEPNFDMTPNLTAPDAPAVDQQACAMAVDDEDVPVIDFLVEDDLYDLAEDLTAPRLDLRELRDALLDTQLDVQQEQVRCCRLLAEFS